MKLLSGSFFLFDHLLSNSRRKALNLQYQYLTRMDKKIGTNWETINTFLSNVGDNLNILEEEVDLAVQKEYFNIVQELSSEPEKYKQLSSQYLEEINHLFDDSIDDEVKKKMLVVLASIDDISVYRAIESLSKTDTPLKKWAIIALQQSRMLIQSTLMDDPGIFISTGLGGQNGLLRYFCVFLYRNQGPLEKFQQQVVYNEMNASLKPWKGVLEQIRFFKDYCTLLLLLPLNADLKSLFEKTVNECNLYGNFLHENMIVTNIKKLSAKEIQSVLRKKK